MEILYADTSVVVCIKPVGVSSEDGENTMPSLLREALGGSVFPVHRLDLNVGGVMAYARTAKAAAALSRAIQENRLKKEYLAVVHGTPEPKEAVLEDFLFKDAAKNKVFVVKRPRKGAKTAKLSYRVLSSQADRSLVQIALYTGRSHQIRVQFASRKHPLFGDGKYGAKDHCKSPALWSFRLTFPHPDSGKLLTFEKQPEGEIWN